MAAATKHRIQPEFALAHARRADREGSSAFAEAVVRWVVDRAAIDGDKEGRWAAIGDLGRILENAGRLGEAVSLWQDAFKEGSRDPETASRLSMHLERAKDYIGATAVIREGLSRGLPANVEESLRKQLARCEAKTAGKDTSKDGKHDVAAYSVRRGSDLFEPLFQARLKPPIKDLESIGNFARCLLASKESSTLVDIDLVSGSEVRRVDNLPLLGDTWFAPDGRGLGTREQLSTLYRLSLAEYLGSAIVLDDQLVQSDDNRMDWFRALLGEKARNFQILVFTCRPIDYLAKGALVPKGSVTHIDSDGGFVRAVDLGRAIRRRYT